MSPRRTEAAPRPTATPSPPRPAPTPTQTNNGDFTATYTVDISGRIGADTAYVGFTGGTGGLFSLQDVLNWTYGEQEANLPPRAPGNLQVVSDVRHDANRDDVTLA